MFRYLFIIFFTFLVVCASSCKKDVLHWQKVQKLNLNTNSQLNRIRFINDSICIIAGGEKYARSDIFRSLDGGYTWTNNSSPDAQKGMYGMGISPDGTIYLCGVDGDVLYSKDTGKTWHFKRIYNWLFYVSLSFPSNDTGIFINTIVQEFSNVTEVDTNFNIISNKNYSFGLNNIYMLSQSTGYMIGYGVVMKTTDYRHNWQFQNVVGDNFMAMDIHGDEIWMCGYNGGIYHTSNGGNSWERFRNGNDITLPRYHLYSIVFKDSQNGWAVGENGKVIHSDDGGRHWEEYDQFTTSNLFSVAICPNGDLLVAGDGGALYRILPK